MSGADGKLMFRVVPKRLECVGRVLLLGVRDPDSPLSLLRSVARNLLPVIYSIVQSMYESHIVVDEFVQNRDTRRSEEGSPCVSSWNLCNRGWELPDPSDPPININMMPCKATRESLAMLPNVDEWLRYLEHCEIPLEEDELFYLTIQESVVPAGRTQRRPGLHVEAPGTLVRPGSFYISPSEISAWGGSKGATGTKLDGGLYMVSDRDKTCRIWHCRIDRPEQVVGEGGSIEHMRAALNRVATSSLLHSNHIWWISDATPHESLPMRSEGRRTFVRIVTSNVTAWFADHSTPNPNTPLPPDVLVVHGNKFIPSSADTVSGPCGYCHAVLPKMFKCTECGALYCNAAHLQLDSSCRKQSTA